MATDGVLQQKFLAFAAFGSSKSETQLDGRSFVKLFKDAGLMKKGLTQTDLDLIFAKVKAKAARKISFSEFLEALPTVADKRGMSIDDVRAVITAAEGPQAQATQAEYVKFHDDKTTYTGVHSNGGPSIVDGDKDLRALCDRTPAADNRGTPCGMTSNFSRSR